MWPLRVGGQDLFIHRSKRNGRTKRNFQIFTATVERIPPKSQQTVRYYSLYSNKRRGLDAKAADIETKLREMKPNAAADVFAAGEEETLAFLRYPSQHRRSLHTNNPLERIMKKPERSGNSRRQMRRRTRVVGAFPDGRSALMLACARLRHIAGTMRGDKRYLDRTRLCEQEAAEKEEAA